MTKTLNQIIFSFLHQNQNIFFSNIGNQNIFFRKIIVSNNKIQDQPPSPPLIKLSWLVEHHRRIKRNVNSTHFSSLRDGPFNLKGGVMVFFSKKNILIPNVAEKNILILVEERKNNLIQRFCHIT
jgi:hypothetical protein